MRRVTANINNDVAYIVPLTDTHIGDPGFTERKLRHYIDWILEREHCYVMLLGDIFETPISGSRATNVWELKNGLSPMEAEATAIDIFTPIASRIVGVVEGNHELRSTQMTGTSSLIRLSQALDLMDVYDKKVVRVKLSVRDIDYNIVGTHGWGGARLLGGQLNKIASMSNVTADADVFVTGHEHSLVLARHEVDLEREGFELRQLYIGCGCFVEWTDFQQGIQRAKPSIGAPRIRFDGTRRDVHVSI
ncbi:hypothetical protein LCGC14_0796340 [marine sediment metagenome]|uniref:Calcineurin-like phosphoesterase domain-containing protein n=1 Tax=marine sediment metagenome TaxID=412755 RepID=A0A0F9PQX7_9ZZZZ